MSSCVSGDRTPAGTLELAGLLAIAVAVVYILATLAGSLLDPSYSRV